MSEFWHERHLKKVSKRQQDHRDPFQRDRARILHSAAFRRLQSKTQVMGSGQSDFYRTRLTHSLEAAQIGSGITAQLRCKFPELCQKLFPATDSLVEAICLAHDIGHPPFGHGGEVALHYMMREHGGFEGNGQTFRIVARLEPFSESHGMNLSRRTLLGLLKYPQTLDQLSNPTHTKSITNFRQLKASEWHPPKGLYLDDKDIIDWVLEPLSASDKALFQSINSQKNNHHKTRFKSLDCSMMELADDIAYGIHDLEDAIVTGVVNQHDFNAHVIEKLLVLDDAWLSKYCESLTSKLFSEEHYLQKDAIGGLVNYLITAVELTDLNDDNRTKNGKLASDVTFEEPLLQYNATLPKVTMQALKIFKDFVYNFVIKQTNIQRLEYRGRQIVMELFEALSSDPLRLLPSNSARRWQHAIDHNENAYRVIADYIAGMTDDYATRLYQTLFTPNTSTNYHLS
ncbi:deoxyguanosinetriphosphate triphosphohydrolase family protein [Colwellia sp. MSW7]|uniref:Deoxyguanosinetriphosphate triphosphohydrolase-like protein n=1 Tax=Colwellia maritima TaxID=2912588 RepID=A0ABS9X5I9_9GAMM|nr:anti-phage deoxyguanosine triphosphatase [Colwellia maritima]MCI2285500.1 deoxyguanosinetriphosphate triphosphohydrolase family protein [Colwellia maritima]